MLYTKTLFLLLSAIFMLSACSSNPIRHTDEGIIVKVQNRSENGPKSVRLEVLGEKIIRVSATPERRFADPQSLVVLPVKENTQFEVKQNGDTVTVQTNAIKAHVLISTGEVFFTDLQGHLN